MSEGSQILSDSPALWKKAIWSTRLWSLQNSLSSAVRHSAAIGWLCCWDLGCSWPMHEDPCFMHGFLISHTYVEYKGHKRWMVMMIKQDRCSRSCRTVIQSVGHTGCTEPSYEVWGSQGPQNPRTKCGCTEPLIRRVGPTGSTESWIS